MAIPSFIYGGNTGETQDTLARKREIAKALMVKAGAAPRNVGEGLSAVGNALLFRSLMKKVDAGEKETAANASMDFAPIASSYRASPSVIPGQTGGNMPKVDRAGNLPPVDISGDKETFVSSLLPAAIEESKRTGVDPRIIVAQAAQETGWGKSAPGNNYFGIKSHGKEGGQTLATNEVIDGKTVRVNDSFRQFGSPAESVRGYGDFLLENPRYEKMRTAQGLDAQLAELGASGYATDPNYSSSVGAIARGIQLPTEVASLDPSSGMDQSAAQAIQEQAPLPVGESLADEAAAFRQTPEYAAQFPGQQVGQPDPRVAVALANPQVASQGALPVIGGQEAQQQPQANPQVAQALMQGDRSGVGVGGDVPGAGYFPAQPNQAGQSGPSMQQLMQAAANPNLNEGQKAVVNALLQQKMEMEQKASDPAYQMSLEKGRLELDALKNPKGEFGFVTLPDGTVLRTDKNAGNVSPIYQSDEKPTPDQQNYEYYRDFETKAGRTPLGPLEWEVAQKKASASSTTINNGEGDKFYENLDKKNAETFSALSDTGMQARSKLAQIDRLEGLLANAPQGAVGALKQAAGEWGIATEGLSDIQAASALLEKMVPEQRAPGSGPMSDADIKMFRASLPRIINQSGGNQLIFQTMRGIAQYEQQMGEIADRVANRDRKEDGEVYSPADARRDIANLQNPLAGFKIPDGKTSNQSDGPARPQTDEEFNALPSGSMFVDPDDGNIYRKP